MALLIFIDNKKIAQIIFKNYVTWTILVIKLPTEEKLRPFWSVFD